MILYLTIVVCVIIYVFVLSVFLVFLRFYVLAVLVTKLLGVWVTYEPAFYLGVDMILILFVVRHFIRVYFFVKAVFFSPTSATLMPMPLKIVCHTVIPSYDRNKALSK